MVGPCEPVPVAERLERTPIDRLTFDRFITKIDGMFFVRPAVLSLRAFLVLLFAILLVLQFLSLPGQFAHMASESPDLAYLRWPLTAVSAIWVLCAQVVIVCTWRLVSLVAEGRIFSVASFGWVDGIVAAFVAAWLVLVGVAAYFGPRATDPSGPLILSFLATVLTVAALLMIVMRALLRQATALRLDMEAVI